MKLYIIDKAELAKGEREEAEEHGFEPEVAHKTALDHLEKKDPYYYSKLAQFGLEDEELQKCLEEYASGFNSGEMGSSKDAQGIKSSKSYPFNKENTGGRLKRIKKAAKKGPVTAVGGSGIGPSENKEN